MVGSIFVAGLAWAIIPQDRVYFEYLGTPFNSWRMFMALAAVPSGLCVLGTLIVLFAFRAFVCLVLTSRLSIALAKSAHGHTLEVSLHVTLNIVGLRC
jgi:hypothetical protein